MESVFIERNLRRTKWLIFGTYCPPSQPEEYFFKHVGYALDSYRQTYEKIFLAAGFNAEETEPYLSEFLTSYDSKSLVKHKKMYVKVFRLSVQFS